MIILEFFFFVFCIVIMCCVAVMAIATAIGLWKLFITDKDNYL